MKILGGVLAFIVFFLFIGLIFVFDGVSVNDSQGIETKFKTGDKVYVSIDSVRAVIETSWYFIESKTVDKVKSKTLTDEKYDLMYTDKNGVIHRLKWVNSELLIKIR
jgi:hypothetical protein